MTYVEGHYAPSAKEVYDLWQRLLGSRGGYYHSVKQFSGFVAYGADHFFTAGF